MTFEELARKSLRTIGAIGQGVPLSPNDLDVAWQACIDMFDSFAADRLTVYQTLRKVFLLVAHKGAPDNPYTIGLGGDFNVPRPVWIPNAAVIFKDQDPKFEIEVVVLAPDEYARISIKELQSSLPQALYVDYQFDQSGPDTGLANLFLYPVPTGESVLDLVLYLPTPMQMWPGKTDDLRFPPGYAEMLRYQLAKRLASEFQKELTADTKQLIDDTFAIMARPNAAVPTLRCDYGVPNVGAGSGGLWNWRTGANVRRGG